ncbi:MAG: hypothetical protein Q3996_00490 [Candidatus Saccharibacteria bacterium]|nr:hypothetical protein [Candidatus Saccharibacteria bacterium]
MKYFKSNLNQTEVLILQQISQDHEDRVSDLAIELREPTHKIRHQLYILKQKGLIVFSSSKDALVHLTRKGRDLVRYLWNDTNFATAM